MKRCCRCKENLPESNFNRNKTTIDGLAFYCRSCVSVANKLHRDRKFADPVVVEQSKKSRRERYATDGEYRERTRAHNRNWNKTPQGRHSLRMAEHRRREGEAGDSLSLEDWVLIIDLQNGKCARCRLSFDEVGRPEKDHVIPCSIGGSLSITGCQALCRSCNASKADTSVDYRDTWQRFATAWVAGEVQMSSVRSA